MAIVPAGSSNTEREIAYPYGNHYFALEVNKQEVAYFIECSGLKSATTVFEIEEGGMNGRTHKRPGQSKWENIVLRCATQASWSLLEWRDKIMQDKFESTEMYSGSIKLLNHDGKVVRRWSFAKAWAVSWEGPALNAGGSELAIETLEIAHDGLTVSNT